MVFVNNFNKTLTLFIRNYGFLSVSLLCSKEGVINTPAVIIVKI
jgi:hypothetical protein